MEAMILAAGVGRRLRPLTERVPKALVDVGGRPLLGHVMERLVEAGATRLIVNAHHHVDPLAAWLERHAPQGVEVALSLEPDGPYDTGGGLLRAAALFRGDGPFLLHNVDVLSRIPLRDLLAAHRAAGGQEGGQLLATLAVQSRVTRRQLLFDRHGLTGWENRDEDGRVLEAEHARNPEGPLERWSFTGIHAIDPVMLRLCDRAGTFSIITWYLDLVRRGYRIAAADMSGHDWIDVGTADRLAEARRRLADWT